MRTSAGRKEEEQEQNGQQNESSTPGVPAAGLKEVADSVVLGVPGDQRRGLGGEVIGGDALQTRDFQSETHRAQTGRGETLQHTDTQLKQKFEDGTSGLVHTALKLGGYLPALVVMVTM